MARSRKPPKDAAKYLLPLVAATRLINIALENILWQRHGTRVKWSLHVQYWHTDAYKPGEKQIAICGGFKASSGDAAGSDLELALAGHAPPATGDAAAPEPEKGDPA